MNQNFHNSTAFDKKVFSIKPVYCNSNNNEEINQTIDFDKSRWLYLCLVNGSYWNCSNVSRRSGPFTVKWMNMHVCNVHAWYFTTRTRASFARQTDRLADWQLVGHIVDQAYRVPTYHVNKQQQKKITWNCYNFSPKFFTISRFFSYIAISFTNW